MSYGTLFRYLYTLLLYLGIPYLFFHLLWRSLKNTAYRKRWGERFGLVSPAIRGPFDIWLHAVSVGEAQAAQPLVNEILTKYPGIRILVTTTTPTGSDRVVSLFGERVSHCYAPYDLPNAVARFLQVSRPKLAVFMETEIWPNTFRQCRDQNVPVAIVNARLSERSANGYHRVLELTRDVLQDVSLMAVQAHDDASRFIRLGMDETRLSVTGSIKFDIHLSASVHEQAQVLRRFFGVDRDIVIAASTHEGEDGLVLDAFSEVLKARPECLLLLVPRHPERFDQVAELAQQRGFSVARRSESRLDSTDIQVFVGDTMGELPVFYAASDVAFVGGSLVPTGGHNMLEPAALGLPILLGPHCFNFAAISQALINIGAAYQVNDREELAKQLVLLLGDANQRRSMGDKGLQLVEENRGALHHIMELLAPYIQPGTDQRAE